MIGFVFAAAFALVSVIPQVSYAKPIVTTSCSALDATGALFTDPAARLQTNAAGQSGNINLVCVGVIPPVEIGTFTAPIHFDQTTVPSAACVAGIGLEPVADVTVDDAVLPRWTEDIAVDGTFTLNCHKVKK
jgi:hypothetical protein